MLKENISEEFIQKIRIALTENISESGKQIENIPENIILAKNFVIPTCISNAVIISPRIEKDIPMDINTIQIGASIIQYKNNLLYTAKKIFEMGIFDITDAITEKINNLSEFDIFIDLEIFNNNIVGNLTSREVIYLIQRISTLSKRKNIILYNINETRDENKILKVILETR